MTEFTSEWIAKQKEILNNSVTKSNQLAGIDNTVVVGVYGYDEEVGYYDYNKFADCGNKNDAEFIYHSCMNYPKALDHIERLQKRVQELEALNECITDLQIEIDDLKRSRNHWKQTAQHQFRYGG